MKRAGILRAAAVMVLFAHPSMADQTAKQLLDTYDRESQMEREMDHLALQAFARGLDYGNEYLQRNAQRPMFCRPEKMSLQGEQIVDILQRFIKRNPTFADIPYGLAVLTALHDVFPCGGNP